MTVAKVMKCNSILYMLKLKQTLLLFLALMTLTNIAFADNQLSANTEIVIDSVVASVDGKPITLQDVSKKLYPQREIAFKDLSNDVEARAALDALILEKLVLLEAETRKLGVSNSEIDEYINEVATRNNLTRGAFEAALAQENKKIEDYKRELKVDILKSKLTSSLLRGSVSVTEEEIDAYIKEHPQYSGNTAKLRLSQILLRLDKRSEEEAQKALQEVLDKIKAGESFANLARNISDGPEAAEGGSIGLVSEGDLTSDIFDAVFSLGVGETSKIVKTQIGLHLFRVDERIAAVADNKDSSEANPIREEVRKLIYQSKVQEKSSSFLISDLYKLHVVDKKI
jgi:parvulin-like peptidyl-prolyl isomerase